MFSGVLLLQEDPAHLRSVAVRDDQLDTTLDDVGQHFARVRQDGAHLLGGAGARVRAQCVATKGDDGAHQQGPGGTRDGLSCTTSVTPGEIRRADDTRVVAETSGHDHGHRPMPTAR